MSASWSPTRPAVLVLAKSDGTLDFWDFADQSHNAAFTVPVTSGAITAIEYRISSLAQQSLAVGDELGNLHVLEIPRNMRKMLNNEAHIMQNFLNQEEKKVVYVKERNDYYAAEFEEKSGADGGDAGAEDEDLAFQLDNQLKIKKLEEAEAEYRRFEEKMRAELGLDNEIDIDGVEVELVHD